jgi:hypothetical protein
MDFSCKVSTLQELQEDIQRYSQQLMKNFERKQFFIQKNVFLRLAQCFENERTTYAESQVCTKKQQQILEKFGSSLNFYVQNESQVLQNCVIQCNEGERFSQCISTCGASFKKTAFERLEGLHDEVLNQFI